jgi:hypothetical protein
MEFIESFRYARVIMRMARVLLLAFILMTAGQAPVARAGIRVISDLDDTAKITNVNDPFLAIMNGLFSTRSFVGMRELYQAFANGRSYGFDYVSAAPEFLRFRADAFLKAGDFPKGQVHLKPSFGDETIYSYKLRVVRELLIKYPFDEFILVGDDTQADFEVYDEIFRSYPDRILATYIRRISNHRLPPSAFAFITAFDVVRTEFLLGRFTVDQAEPVASTLLSEKRTRRIVPRFVTCPTTPVFTMDPKIDEWNQLIDDRVQKICQ